MKTSIMPLCKRLPVVATICAFLLLPATVSHACGWPYLEIHPAISKALLYTNVLAAIVLGFAVYVRKQSDNANGLVSNFARAMLPFATFCFWLVFGLSVYTGRQYMGVEVPTHLPISSDPRTILALGFVIIAVRLMLGRYERRTGLIVMGVAALAFTGYTAVVYIRLGEVLTPYQKTDPFERLDPGSAFK